MRKRKIQETGLTVDGPPARSLRRRRGDGEDKESLKGCQKGNTGEMVEKENQKGCIESEKSKTHRKGSEKSRTSKLKPPNHANRGRKKTQKDEAKSEEVKTDFVFFEEDSLPELCSTPKFRNRTVNGRSQAGRKNCRAKKSVGKLNKDTGTNRATSINERDAACSSPIPLFSSCSSQEDQQLRNSSPIKFPDVSDDVMPNSQPVPLNLLSEMSTGKDCSKGETRLEESECDEGVLANSSPIPFHYSDTYASEEDNFNINDSNYLPTPHSSSTGYKTFKNKERTERYVMWSF